MSIFLNFINMVKSIKKSKNDNSTNHECLTVDEIKTDLKNDFINKLNNKNFTVDISSHIKHLVVNQLLNVHRVYENVDNIIKKYEDYKIIDEIYVKPDLYLLICHSDDEYFLIKVFNADDPDSNECCLLRYSKDQYENLIRTAHMCTFSIPNQIKFYVHIEDK